MRKILVLRGGALGDFIVTLPALALLRDRWPGSRIELVGNATAAQLALRPRETVSPATTPDARSSSTTTPSGEGLPAAPALSQQAPRHCHPLDDNLNSAPEGVLGVCHLMDDKHREAAGGAAAGNFKGRALVGSGWTGPLLDAVHSQHEGRWAALYGREPLPPALAGWLAEFDLIINYWPDPEGELNGRFPCREGQIFLATTALPTSAPAARHYCAPLQGLGLETADYFCRLETGAPKNAPFRAPTIAIHPGSGSPSKNWPPERWARLCEWLKTKYPAELLNITGDADSIAADQLAAFGRPARNLSLVELAAQLAQCRLFIGHDSGVSHLAAACGVPCLLLFGPTDPAIWAPPTPLVRVIKSGTTLESISLAEVQAAVGAALSGPA